ncbi:MAG: DUF1186 domain-containing protein [Bacteroidota bacterium]|nr:DUF1186 domain-containing protein [Bacteroidota bacterium]
MEENIEETFEYFGYKLTDDPELLNKESGITPELSGQMESLHNKALKGGKKNIDYLIHKIEQYPDVPQLKNFLSVAYMNSGKTEKSFEVNNWIIKEHPNYLFGLLNKAYEYYLNEQYEKIPELLGDLLEIKALYPERDIFHILEVVSFNKLAVLYFSAIGNLEAAESRFELLEELAPDHRETETAFQALMIARMQEGHQEFLEEEKTRISSELTKYNKSVQTDKTPEFENFLINELYQNDVEINHDILKEILGLPRELIISDLKKVLNDSICRFEYFKALNNEGNINVKDITFPIHAAFLLGELKASEALDDILETFRQGDEFINFWYGDFITDTLWLPLYQLAEGKLDALKEFMLEPGIYTFAKSEISTAVIQYYYHHPEKRGLVLPWFESVLNEYLTTEKENLVDSELIGLMICDIMEADFKEIIPLIEKLYEKGFVGQGVCGPLDEVKEDFGIHEIEYWKRDEKSIFEMYDYIVNNWYSYNKEKYNKTFGSLHRNEETYVREEPKIGRNDPCPCGSGKKYKKCCMNKQQKS